MDTTPVHKNFPICMRCLEFWIDIYKYTVPWTDATHQSKRQLDRVELAVFPEYTLVSNGWTDSQTDRQQEPTRNSTQQSLLL